MAAPFITQATAQFPGNADVTKQLALLGDVLGQSVREYNRFKLLGSVLPAGSGASPEHAAAIRLLRAGEPQLASVLIGMGNRAEDVAYRNKHFDFEQQKTAEAQKIAQGQLGVQQGQLGVQQGTLGVSQAQFGLQQKKLADEQAQRTEMINSLGLGGQPVAGPSGVPGSPAPIPGPVPQAPVGPSPVDPLRGADPNTRAKVKALIAVGDYKGAVDLANKAWEQSPEFQQRQAEAKTVITAKQDLPKKLEPLDDALNLVDDLLKNEDALKNVTGVNTYKKYIPNTPEFGLSKKLDQLTGKAFLDAYASLKGGGVITEIEGQKATEAKARLSTAQTHADFVQSLRDYKTALETGKRNLRTAAQTGQGNYTIGQVRSGYKFLGGDPKRQDNWEPVEK